MGKGSKGVLIWFLSCLMYVACLLGLCRCPHVTRYRVNIQELFTPKDRLDYRYFYKRAYYLGVVKAGLAKASKAEGNLSGASIAWDCQDERRPVIAITVGKGAFCYSRS